MSMQPSLDPRTLSKDAPIIAADFAAPAASTESRKPKSGGKKVHKPHLATKIKWVLQDTEERMIEAQRTMNRVLDWVEAERNLHTGDTAYLARLGQLSHYLARVTLTITETERMIATALVESKEVKSTE